MSAHKRGFLGKALVPAGVLTLVYALPAIDIKQYDQSQAPIASTCYANLLNLSNITPAIINVYVATSSIVGTVDLIEFNLSLPALATFVRGPIRISAGEGIYILSDSDIVVRVEGSEGAVVL